MNSAIYEGTIEHYRLAPEHRFLYRMAVPLLDLSEVDDVFSRHPLWSARRPAPVWFRRADYLGPPETPLGEAVRDLVQERLGRRPDGRVAMLAHVRTLGWCFNPIVVYYCSDADGSPAAVVCDLTTTPWHERHAYVLEASSDEHVIAKDLHVSPFLPMDLTHRLRFTEPDEELEIVINNDRGGEPVFGARLHLRRREITRREMTRVLLRYPLQTWRVSAGIYGHAFRLWRKGATYYPHPGGKRALRSQMERIDG